MKKFESFELLLNNLKLNDSDKEYAIEELTNFLVNEGSDPVDTTDEEPHSHFLVEAVDFNYLFGVTSIQIEDSLKQFFWVINDNEAKAYKENELLIDTLNKAIDTIAKVAHSSNVTDVSIMQLNNMIDEGDYSEDAIDDCICKIKSSARYAGYFNIQHELIKEVNEILEQL